MNIKLFATTVLLSFLIVPVSEAHDIDMPTRDCCEEFWQLNSSQGAEDYLNQLESLLNVCPDGSLNELEDHCSDPSVQQYWGEPPYFLMHIIEVPPGPDVGDIIDDANGEERKPELAPAPGFRDMSLSHLIKVLKGFFRAVQD